MWLGVDKKWIALLAVIAGFLIFFGDTAGNAIEALEAEDEDVDPMDPFYRFDSLFHKYSAQYGVPWRWMKAICLIESSLGRARSVARGLEEPTDVEGSKSTDGLSWGIMQVTLKTARALEGQMIQAPYLNDPDNSVRLGAKVLKENIDRFGIDDRESVIRSYNGGPKFGAATLPYYTKFIANLAIVQSKQPGNELELG